MHANYRSLRSLVLLGLSALAICLSGEASATPSALQVTITSGDAAPIVITSSNFLESSPVNINGWTIDGLNGGANSDTMGVGIGGTPTCQSYPATCVGLTCTAYPCTVDPLTIEVSETGFEVGAVGSNSKAVGFYLEDACCVDIPAGITMSMSGYISASDELDMTTTSLASLTLTGPLPYQSDGAPSTAKAVGPSPYSLTLIDTFTADSTGLYLPQEENTYIGALALSIPEPPSVSLFAVGLLAIGFVTLSRRRRRPAPLGGSDWNGKQS